MINEDKVKKTHWILASLHSIDRQDIQQIFDKDSL